MEFRKKDFNKQFETCKYIVLRILKSKIMKKKKISFVHERTVKVYVKRTMTNNLSVNHLRARMAIIFYFIAKTRLQKYSQNM